MTSEHIQSFDKNETKVNFYTLRNGQLEIPIQMHEKQIAKNKK